MPSDLIIDVRQVSSYPPITQSNGSETILLQQGGLGGPYASIDTSALVATALRNGPAMGIGATPPANAGGEQIFTGSMVFPDPGAGPLYNLYFDTTGQLRYVNAGIGGAVAFEDNEFAWQVTPAGSAGQAVPDQAISNLMLLNIAGNLQLPFGTLSVARDPAAAGEVVTLAYLGKSTVSSFNNRNGQVQLNAADVYAALKLTDPIATQPWVNQAITNSIQNLLVTCPFVNKWNNRTGSVYLMLSDITTVFYQPGQQPISPTPPITSNDDSIATTKWVQEHPPALTASAPPLNPTSGQLWWNDVDGNLYVYYVDPTSAQWVSAMATMGGGGGVPEPGIGGPFGRVIGAWEPVLSLTGGTLSGLLTLQNGLTSVGPTSFSNATAAVTGFTWNQNVFGAAAAGQATWFSSNIGDSADTTSAFGAGALAHYFGLNIQGGAGGRTALQANLVHTGVTTTVAGQYYVAEGAFADASASAGGTAAVHTGALFGRNCGAALLTGAGPFWISCVGDEIDVGVEAGCAVDYKAALSIVQYSTDASRGVVDDCAIGIATQINGTAPGWNVGLQFGQRAGWWAFTANSTLIGTQGGFPAGPPMVADWGIDLSAVTFTGGFLRGPGGFVVNGVGNAIFGNGVQFGAVTAPGGATDLSRHIELFGGGYAGFSVTSGFLNHVCNGAHAFYSAGAEILTIAAAEITVSAGRFLVIDLEDAANDAAAGIAGVPINGLYRTGNAVQVRLV